MQSNARILYFDVFQDVNKVKDVQKKRKIQYI